MNKYLLYVNTQNEGRIITKDDVAWKLRYKGTGQRWVTENFLSEIFMAGDVKLDNGFECVGELTEAEVFAELL